MKMTFMIMITLYLKVIIDNIVDVTMFYEFKDSEMTRFGRELIL